MNNCGALVKPLPVRTYKYDLLAGGYKAKTDLPDEYEIPLNYLPVIHDQGETYSCVAHSLCECAESKKLSIGENELFSTGWNYGRDESRNGYDGQGLFIDTALQAACKIGFVPKHYFDFSDDVTKILELAKERDDLKEIGKQFKFGSYVELSSAIRDKKWDNICTALMNYNCPIILISSSYFPGGSHAIIGYGFTNVKNTKKGKFIKFQNSWGLQYGDNGKGLIPIERVDYAYLPLWDDIKLPFFDVTEDHWAYKDIRASYMSGLIKGITETKYAPNEMIIRADFTLIIERLMIKLYDSLNMYIRTIRQFGKDVSEIKLNDADMCPYAYYDISKDDYFYNSVRFVSANGIMNGVSFDRFEPYQEISRAEAATIIVRLYEKILKSISNIITFDISYPSTFTNNMIDVYPNDWYYSYINKVMYYKLMIGYDDKTFKPHDSITRAECASIINRLSKCVDVLLKEF